MAEPAVQFQQAQAYDADGKPVAPDQAPALVAAGKAFYQQGARVYARNPRGELVTVAPEDAARPGYQVLAPGELQQAQAQKQYGEGLGNVATATVAGAARGLTLGASDAVAGAIGGEDTRRALEGLRQANPIASGAGEVAGAVAPLLLSGGATGAVQGGGALARAGQLGTGAVRTLGAGHRVIAGVGGLVERGAARGLAALGVQGTGAAARVAAAAAKLGTRGAAEGALYGAAQAANDAVLRGDEITAEKIVAGMGHGALFGGALGAGLGAVARGTGELAPRLIPKKEALLQLGREQGLKAAGFKGSDFRKLAGRATGEKAEARLAATADDLLNTKLTNGERVLQPGANVEETLARVSLAKEEAAARLGGLKDEISEGMAAVGKSPDVGVFLQRVEDEVLAPLRKSNVPGVRSQVRAVERQLSLLRQKADDELNKLGLENSRYLRTGMREESLTYARSAYEGASPVEARAIALGERPGVGGQKIEPVRVHLEPGSPPILNDGRHRMAAAKEAGADSIMANVVRYDDAGNVLGEELRPISISAGGNKVTFRELDKFRQDLRSVFQPVAPPSGGLPPPAPKAAAALEKTERVLADQLKQDAGTFLASIGENPNAYNEANRMFHSFRQLEQVGTKTANQSLGNRSISPSDHALGVASFLGALTTGNAGALGSMAIGGAGALANKLLRERGNSLVADMARRASQTDSIIETAAAALAGKAEKAKAPALATAFEGKDLAEQYQRTSERVRELATPAIAQQHLSAMIPEVAAQYPDVGAAVSRKLLAIYQQLAAALPRSHVETGTTLTPLAVRERVSPVAMRKFMSTAAGMLEPERVIADLGRGIIDRDAIEALKIAHPQTFMQLRQKVADFVQERQDELPFKRRVMLSMTFDFVGDSSLSPERMAGLQQTAQALTAADQAQQAAMVKPKSGGGSSKVGESMMTPHDSIFSGDM